MVAGFRALAFPVKVLWTGTSVNSLVLCKISSSLTKETQEPHPSCAFGIARGFSKCGTLIEQSKVPYFARRWLSPDCNLRTRHAF